MPLRKQQMFDELRHYTIPISKRKVFLTTEMEIYAIRQNSLPEGVIF